MLFTLADAYFKPWEHVMMSNPKRTVLAGLLLGALVIGASVMRSGEDKVSERDGVSVSGELDNSSTETRASNPLFASGHSDDVAHILQAVRDSLERNDLASAKVLLGAVQTLHKDDSRALTLQKELQAREGKVDTVPPATPPDKPPNSVKSTRPVSRSGAKADPIHGLHGRTTTGRGHAITAPRYSSTAGTPEVKAPSGNGVNVEAHSPAIELDRTDSTSPEAAQPLGAIAPARPTSSRVIPPSEEAPPLVQPVLPKPLPIQSGQAPKTRAQVRAELDRARSDGSLPRFGNPDPAGPGGVPSGTKREFGSE
jgi:hypothetical protein